jgi:hypothetical protein
MADDNLPVILLAASCERYVSGPLETMKVILGGVP